MNFILPAKTFLVGEYIALSHGPAILLCTSPCFTMMDAPDASCDPVHPDSPAGRYWRQMGHTQALGFRDPYGGMGGFGASSAQFVGAYLLDCALKAQKPSFEGVHEAYLSLFEGAQGYLPSGYDVLAQMSGHSVFIDKKGETLLPVAWEFDDMGLVLFHTGKKLPTHQHLSALRHCEINSELEDLVLKAHAAFQSHHALMLCEAVNGYHQALYKSGMLARHAELYIEALRMQPGVMAIKGCGAMGADVILVLVQKAYQKNLIEQATKMGLILVATQAQLYPSPVVSVGKGPELDKEKGTEK